MRENLSGGEGANNIGADQPVHPHSLIAPLLFALMLESFISKLDTGEIPIF